MLYAALCECQMLHPDEEDEDAGEMYSAFENMTSAAGEDEGDDDDGDEEDDVCFPVPVLDANGNPGNSSQNHIWFREFS